MGILHELKNCIPDNKETKFFRKWYEVPKILNEGLAACAAGDNGAIDVYRDDIGLIQCRAHRRMMTVDEREFRFLKTAKEWVDEWLIKIK